MSRAKKYRKSRHGIPASSRFDKIRKELGPCKFSVYKDFISLNKSGYDGKLKYRKRRKIITDICGPTLTMKIANETIIPVRWSNFWAGRAKKNVALATFMLATTEEEWKDKKFKQKRLNRLSKEIKQRKIAKDRTILTVLRQLDIDSGNFSKAELRSAIEDVYTEASGKACNHFDIYISCDPYNLFRSGKGFRSCLDMDNGCQRTALVNLLQDKNAATLYATLPHVGPDGPMLARMFLRFMFSSAGDIVAYDRLYGKTEARSMMMAGVNNICSSHGISLCRYLMYAPDKNSGTRVINVGDDAIPIDAWGEPCTFIRDILFNNQPVYNDQPSSGKWIKFPTGFHYIPMFKVLLENQ